MKRISTNSMMVGLLFAIISLGFWGCKKDSVVTNTTNAVNMTNYLKEHPETFSELTKVLQITGTADFLNAYGTYTMFAPTNEAIKAFLQEQGKSSVEEIDKEELKNLVRFHLLEDSVKTADFNDGKLRDLTMYGQYLITGAENINGVTKIRVNRQANIVQPNISVGNGIIHSIDHILTPATQTVAQTIGSNADYSIFAEALTETKLYDTLNVATTGPAKKWFTVIAESDAVLKAAGINDYAALKAKYSNSNDVTSITNGLNLFVRYHILSDAKYLADIIQANAHNTLAPLEVLTSRLYGEQVLINDDVFNGQHEVGFVLPRTTSDVSANNGVIHKASAHFNIKLRSPFRVDFDVATFPELKKMSTVYGKENYLFTKEEVANLSEIKMSTPTEFWYRFGSGQGTSKTSYNQDILALALSASGGSRAEWIEFKTPLLIRGKYKVWIGYYVQKESSSNGGTTTEVQTLMGQENSDERTPLSNGRTLSFITKRPGSAADVEEALGWKIYMESTSGSQSSRMVGIADVPQTGRYWIRLKAINGSQKTNNVDLIQFIPVNMDQQYPKFKIDGSEIPRP